MKEYNAAVYLRLSKEDREINNSIDIQREITTKFAKEHKYNIVGEYVDNGYSGILSSRPALNKLMLDIIRNKVNMIIVKDMSRLTRDKNLTSYYTDIFFPNNEVRFISVTEYIDTGERYEIDDIVALRGIVNENYLQDISKKIKSVKRNLKEQGKFIEASVAYGYKKNQNDKYKLVIDEKVAPIIREIYNSFIDGKKPSEIARNLNKRNIKTASQYLEQKNIKCCWTKSMINRILTNPIYAGNMVLNKYITDFKSKKKVLSPKSQYKILQNTHPGIISQEDYNLVQQIKGNKTKKDFKTYLYLLKGLTYCKHCGRRMTYKNSYPIRIDANGKLTGKPNNIGYFICEEHYRDLKICNVLNKIMEKDLNEIVLKKVSKRLKQLQIEKYTNDILEYRKRQNIKLNSYNKIKKEISKQESNFKMLYLKKVERIIPEEKFSEEYNEYLKKVTELKNRLNRLEKSEKIFESRSDIENSIIEFENCKQFDNVILKNLIEKIEISKDRKVEIILKV